MLKVASSEGFEPPTYRVEICRASNCATKRKNGRCRIRTHGTFRYERLVISCFRPLSQPSLAHKSIGRGLNPQHPVWKTGTLPIELPIRQGLFHAVPHLRSGITPDDFRLRQRCLKALYIEAHPD